MVCKHGYRGFYGNRKGYVTIIGSGLTAYASIWLEGVIYANGCS